MLVYRNDALLALAKHAPECMICGQHNYGQVVACHSNSLQDGKGMGIKAHDIPAYACRECHDYLDGRDGSKDPQINRQLAYYHGVYRTWLMLMREGYLKLNGKCAP